MENQRLDFGEIVRKIAEDKMLLPDFQRGFVWKDEEQRKIVASVLAKMPIGSILLLKSKPDEYASKSIGMKEKPPWFPMAATMPYSMAMRFFCGSFLCGALGIEMRKIPSSNLADRSSAFT